MRNSWLIAVLLSGCAAMRGPSLAERQAAAAPAMQALKDARFDDAVREATTIVERDGGNTPARVVLALGLYRAALHDLWNDLVTIGASLAAGEFVPGVGPNQRFIQFALSQAETRLRDVEQHLAVAARESGFAMDLCLACWQVDWNRSGEVDERDRALLQVEYDARGERIDAGDPRRSPTFRFDAADVAWLRALVAFQRAILDIVLAYDVEAVRGLQRLARSGQELRIKLVDKGRITAARERIFEGIDSADVSRRLALAESDDEREWLPNPKQQDHPLPLPVDDALYATWEGVLADVRKLLRGDEGLDVSAIAQLGDHVWADPPRGFIDIGRLFSEPGDLVLDVRALGGLDSGSEPPRIQVEKILGEIFGDKYQSQMRGSQLISRLARMKNEVKRGEESLERKLRYLLWLN